MVCIDHELDDYDDSTEVRRVDVVVEETTSIRFDLIVAVVVAYWIEDWLRYVERLVVLLIFVSCTVCVCVCVCVFALLFSSLLANDEQEKTVCLSSMIDDDGFVCLKRILKTRGSHVRRADFDCIHALATNDKAGPRTQHASTPDTASLRRGSSVNGLAPQQTIVVRPVGCILPRPCHPPPLQPIAAHDRVFGTNADEDVKCCISCITEVLRQTPSSKSPRVLELQPPT